MQGVVEVEEHAGEEAAGTASAAGARKVRMERKAEDFIVNATSSDYGGRGYFGYRRARHKTEKTLKLNFICILARPTMVGLMSKAEKVRSVLRPLSFLHPSCRFMIQRVCQFLFSAHHDQN